MQENLVETSLEWRGVCISPLVPASVGRDRTLGERVLHEELICPSVKYQQINTRM